MKLAKISDGRIWVNPEIKGDARRRVERHMRVFKEARKEGYSRTEAIAKAKKAEHKGMSQHQISVYEGKLSVIARKKK